MQTLLNYLNELKLKNLTRSTKDYQREEEEENDT